MKRDPHLCSVDSCGHQTAASGLCWKHYARRRRHGDTSVTLRRYGKKHKCRHCGTRNPGDFYEAYRGICKTCRKILRIRKELSPQPSVLIASG
ncbi:MAG TPA: hypothetical protein VGA55_01635 [Bacteroidota bacterium]